MKKGILTFVLLAVAGTIFVLPNFYRNKWAVVEPEYYEGWQTRYDRLVVARLVKTRHDGFWSAGGLLGLGDADSWNFLNSTNRHQYNTYYQDDGSFEEYLVYKSNPGFQGILYGVLDGIPGFDEPTKLRIFRGLTAFASAAVFGIMFSAIAMEFGILAGVLTILFAAFSIWTVLPAGSIFWNLWAFYLPFIASVYGLTGSSKRGIYNARKIHSLLFTATLLRVLLSGFDIITTGMIMTTVPFVYYAIKDRWEWKLFLDRFIKSGLAIAAGTLTGLAIMFAQIIATDGRLANAYSYFEDRFGHHLAGNSGYFLEGNIQATRISVAEIVGKYISMPAINLQQNESSQILYWHLIVLFAVFTVLFFLLLRFRDKTVPYRPRPVALIVATWYSILAPLSWILLFRPHSIIHTHVNTMGWQMPFTLLGFTLCGFTVTNLFGRKTS